MSVVSENETRENERSSLSISTVVKAKENRETFWKETTDLVSISRSGAGFYLQHKCEVGHLLSLMMSMPRHLRCYDQDKELYRVWGLVQHCSPVSGDAASTYHVGVAFVGKKVPASYTENPLQSYRISGMNEDGTWKIVEAQKSFIVRRHSRYWLSFEVLLAAHDNDKNFISDENALTENISLSGAAIYSNLGVDIGDSVQFNCVPHNFSALAVVRNRQTSEYELPKLHLEFIDAVFPVEELSLSSDKEILPGEEDDSTAEENTSLIKEFAAV
ncbi:MAG: PilZ domain-containing protein [Actinomycetota bacterium]